ncbi:hypothetical protein [Ornithinimicrobium kibberense]|uniref:hypothetical protein n=1 Tax=Ornithinimicrobium kibberense TaxID=282060 RepID=UPI00360D905F
MRVSARCSRAARASGIPPVRTPCTRGACTASCPAWARRTRSCSTPRDSSGQRRPNQSASPIPAAVGSPRAVASTASRTRARSTAAATVDVAPRAASRSASWTRATSPAARSAITASRPAARRLPNTRSPGSRAGGSAPCRTTAPAVVRRTSPPHVCPIGRT